MYNGTMRRTNFYITDQQAERLRALSEKSGLSVAEMVRRAIDGYLSLTQPVDLSDLTDEQIDRIRDGKIVFPTPDQMKRIRSSKTLKDL